MKKIIKKTPYSKFSGKGKISLHEVEEMIQSGGDSISHLIVMNIHCFNDKIFIIRKVCLFFIDGISQRNSFTFLERHPEIIEPYNKEPGFNSAFLNSLDMKWSDYFFLEPYELRGILNTDKTIFRTEIGDVHRFGELPRVTIESKENKILDK